MIHGVGTDMVAVDRIQALFQRFGEHFVERILHPKERAALAQFTSDDRLMQFLSGRFAAKEAVSKAFGTGIGSQLSFHDILITPDRHGKPTVTLPKIYAPFQVHLSITHHKDFAVAMAVAETSSATKTVAKKVVKKKAAKKKIVKKPAKKSATKKRAKR